MRADEGIGSETIRARTHPPLEGEGRRTQCDGVGWHGSRKRAQQKPGPCHARYLALTPSRHRFAMPTFPLKGKVGCLILIGALPKAKRRNRSPAVAQIKTKEILLRSIHGALGHNRDEMRTIGSIRMNVRVEARSSNAFAIKSA